MTTLLTEATQRGPGSHQREGAHLSGTLSEVGLPSLLGFFELERTSGILCLDQGARTARIFVREGRIVDVECEAADASTTEALGDLLEWRDGTFEFQFQAVERADSIGKTTSALLIDLARRHDEASRQA